MICQKKQILHENLIGFSLLQRDYLRKPKRVQQLFLYRLAEGLFQRLGVKGKLLRIPRGQLAAGFDPIGFVIDQHEHPCLFQNTVGHALQQNCLRRILSRNFGSNSGSGDLFKKPDLAANPFGGKNPFAKRA